MYQPVYLIVMPVCFRAFPVAVKPDTFYTGIISDDLGELGFHKIDITIPVAIYRYAIYYRAAERIVGATPVQQGIINMQFDALLDAFLRQIHDGVMMIRRGIYNIIR